MKFSDIIVKLKAVPQYPHFIRHVNGNTLDNRVENIRWVTLIDAFNNITTWKVDWVCYLTPEEIKFIKDLLISHDIFYLRGTSS